MAVEPALKVQYVLVRSDLPRGVQTAHVAHAASEAAGHPPTIVVALAVPDEATLRRIAAELGVQPHVLVCEDAGRFAGQAMALGIVPVADRATVRKVVGDLSLVK